jgi:hypothetical protein
MSLSKTSIYAAVLIGSVTLLSITSAPASPLVPASTAHVLKSLSEKNGVPAITVRHRGRNTGVAVAAGVTGLIIGGIIASQSQPYYYDPYYQPYPAYGGAIAYCARRFRSYDPYSMTYLGSDGYRHPCP